MTGERFDDPHRTVLLWVATVQERGEVDEPKKTDRYAGCLFRLTLDLPQGSKSDAEPLREAERSAKGPTTLNANTTTLARCSFSINARTFPCSLLAPTTSLYHDLKFPTTERERWSSLNAGCPARVLSIANDTCAIPPAQVAIGSDCALLTMIRVRRLPFYRELQTNVYIGLRRQHP